MSAILAKLPTTDWYFASNDETIGPVALHELQSKLYDGGLPLSTLVWVDGMADWATAESVGIHLLPAYEAAEAESPFSALEATRINETLLPDSTSSIVPIPLSDLSAPGVAENWQKALSLHNPYVKDASSKPDRSIAPVESVDMKSGIQIRSAQAPMAMGDVSTILDPLESAKAPPSVAMPLGRLPLSQINAPGGVNPARAQRSNGLSQMSPTIQIVALLGVIAALCAVSYVKFGKPRDWQHLFKSGTVAVMPPKSASIPINLPALRIGDVNFKGLSVKGDKPVMFFFLPKACTDCPNIEAMLRKVTQKNPGLDFIKVEMENEKVNSSLKTQTMTGAIPAVRLFLPTTKETFEVITTPGPRYVERRVQHILAKVPAGAPPAKVVTKVAPKVAPKIAPKMAPKIAPKPGSKAGVTKAQKPKNP